LAGKGGGVDISKDADLSRLKIDRELTPGGRRPKASRAHWKEFVLSIILLIVIVVLYHLFSSPPNEPLVRTIVVSQASEGNARGAPILTATGYVIPRLKASVSPRVTGQLVKLYVDVGSKVKEGEILGTLANDDLKAKERRTEAEVESQEALLEEAEANRENLLLEYKRQEHLLKEGAVSQSSFDSARTSLKAAEARVTSARARLRDAKAGLEVILAEIEKTRIRAPFDGTILRKEAEVGEIVGPGYGGENGGGAFAVVTMCDMGSLEVEVDVNETYISRLREGMNAEIMLDAFPDRPYDGVVRKIVPTANRQKATVQVKVAFKDVDDRVLPEMGAKVSFYEEGAKVGDNLEGMMVPASAIHELDGRQVLFAVQGGEVRAVRVEVGPVSGGQVFVKSGLKPGERVIVGGPEGIKPGQRVRLVGDVK